MYFYLYNNILQLTVLFGITGGIWMVYLTLFYTIYWSPIGKDPYSGVLLFEEMLEQFLFFVDPIVYIGMSSELRRPLYKFLGMSHKITPSEATTTRITRTKTPNTHAARPTDID